MQVHVFSEQKGNKLIYSSGAKLYLELPQIYLLLLQNANGRSHIELIVNLEHFFSVYKASCFVCKNQFLNKDRLKHRCYVLRNVGLCFVCHRIYLQDLFCVDDDTRSMFYEKNM